MVDFEAELVADYGELGSLYRVTVEGRDDPLTIAVRAGGDSELPGLVELAMTPPSGPPEYPPPPRLPNLEPDQFWFVVRASGYEPDLLAWVASMNDPESPAYDPVGWAAASAKLEYSKFFERDHPLVEAFRVAMDMPEAELDALWRFAVGL